ncbi:MAG: hypothetical protein GTO45_11515 [Candidatus Aminicenantes bacterium]|nr:hypothetical protein [Candidatus Aminicenantes bacterium]NIM79431.1 hypothetical protein [Candidatus Aminicenantes bacterium]NIN18713.1 hypothetical protein [Candidatus Aminicenantes bacterium]NIN42637.1 hypothetical protein [Candidatus Aminicenantes bacterium]NIN85376.1 hypothetical protein [Candidatus Aminicenantes bacterium]
MEEKATRVYAGLTGVISSIILCGIYVYLHTVPFFHIDLGADRRRYLLMVYLLSVLGVFIFFVAKDKVESWRLKIPLYIFSSIFVIGIPIAACIGSGASQRGWEWAFTTFLIGLPPVLLIISAFLILYGYHFFSLVLCVVFALILLYHVILVVELIGALDKGFSGVWLKDTVIAVIVMVVSAIFAFLNLRHFKSS